MKIILRNLNQDLFNGMYRLEIIDLSSNKIEIIETDLFSNLKSLKKLFINDNNLKTLNNFNLPQLTLLELSDNFLNIIPIETFKKCFKLKELYLDNNLLENFTSDYLGNTSLNYLGLIKNYILNPSILGSEKLEIKHNKLELVTDVLFSLKKYGF